MHVQKQATHLLQLLLPLLVRQHIVQLELGCREAGEQSRWAGVGVGFAFAMA